MGVETRPIYSFTRTRHRAREVYNNCVGDYCPCSCVSYLFVRRLWRNRRRNRVANTTIKAVGAVGRGDKGLAFGFALMSDLTMSSFIVECFGRLLRTSSALIRNLCVFKHHDCLLLLLADYALLALRSPYPLIWFRNARRHPGPTNGNIHLALRERLPKHQDVLDF